VVRKTFIWYRLFEKGEPSQAIDIQCEIGVRDSKWIFAVRQWQRHARVPKDTAR